MKHLVCIRSEDSWVGILSAWLFFIIVKTEIKKVNNQSTICVRYDNAIGGLHQTVLRSKTDAMRSERTKLIQL